jgi:hypothetical protein
MLAAHAQAASGRHAAPLAGHTPVENAAREVQRS